MQNEFIRVAPFTSYGNRKNNVFVQNLFVMFISGEKTATPSSVWHEKKKINKKSRNPKTMMIPHAAHLYSDEDEIYQFKFIQL